MKKNLLCLFVIGLLLASRATGQLQFVHTVAGHGNPPTGVGDGGLAVNGKLSNPVGISKDGIGNLYISDGTARIRKVDATTGIITTIAGTGTSGYSGDGGAAVNAQINGGQGLCADFAGNVYFSDKQNGRVRRVDVITGIITTVAGGGVLTNDGVPATSFQLNQPSGLVMDGNSNLYILCNNGVKIKKVDGSTGIISSVAGAPNSDINCIALDNTESYLYVGIQTPNCGVKKIDLSNGTIAQVAGNGTCGHSGDGGQALNASFYEPTCIAEDLDGNLLVGSDIADFCVRKIDAITGVVTTIGGVGTSTPYKNNLPFNGLPLAPSCLYVSPTNHIYYSDDDVMDAIRIVGEDTITAFAHSDSFSVFAYDHCSDARFTVSTAHYRPGMSVKSYFGDAQSSNSAVASRVGGGTAVFTHKYSNSQNYQVKHVLYDGPNAIDSVAYTYAYTFCRTIPLRLYQDVNANCSYNVGTDHYLYAASLVEVDSNNTSIDTISVSSGLNYDAKGNSGDTYRFKVISPVPGLNTSCPVNGTVTQVIQTATMNYSEINLGFSCAAGNNFDLDIDASVSAHSNGGTAGIVVSNAYCAAQNATVTMSINPKYAFESSVPPPSSQNGNSVSWTIAGLAASTAAPAYISIRLTPSQTLAAGDTVVNAFTIGPTAGDLNAANNVKIVTDTILGPMDPNEKHVSPEGHIPAGTTLEYAIDFENTGNDTAHNIYILDTLSDFLDANSLRVVSSSATMFISLHKTDGHNVARFDFPNINLLDSTHHNLCTGMVVFDINTYPGLLFGTNVDNMAGIFFDDNKVVPTNKVANIIDWPAFTPATKTEHIVIVYPNPANNDIIIEQDNGCFSSCIFTNCVGEVVMKHSLNKSQTKVNVKTLPAGVYYITLKGERGSEVRKFVKM